jgi:hypothetical protein
MFCSLTAEITGIAACHPETANKSRAGQRTNDCPALFYSNLGLLSHAERVVDLDGSGCVARPDQRMTNGFDGTPSA